jgi:pre-mRNA-splicing factor CWC22
VRSKRDVTADISADTEKDNPSTEQSEVPTAQKKVVDLLTTRTGGAYIPPAKLRMMQAQITDKSSAAYQRIAWEALKKSIHGHINKVNTGNITIIVRELFKENIVRGRGLLCRAIIQAQAASPTFTHVYSALVAVINSKVGSVHQVHLFVATKSSTPTVELIHVYYV